MKASLLCALLLVGFVSPPDWASNLSLQGPGERERKVQEVAFVIAPKTVAKGRIYTVVVPDVTTEVGSVEGLLDAGKGGFDEMGTFKPARHPVGSQNGAGWVHESVSGTQEKDGRAIMAQTMGAPKAPSPAAGARKVDLKGKVPEGWTISPKERFVSLDISNSTTRFSLLIWPSEPLKGSLREMFLRYWATLISSNFETQMVPLPLVRRLKSGMACGADTDASARSRRGDPVNVGLYILAQGSRVVPIVGIFYGFDKRFEQAVEEFLESAEIPESGKEKVALFSPADLHGSWDESSVSIASYVTPYGGYAGDASTTVGSSLVLNRNGTFKMTHVAMMGNASVKKHDEGKWRINDSELTLGESRYWVLGVGSGPKGDAFLVLTSFSNIEERLRLYNPRGGPGKWYKRKD